MEDLPLGRIAALVPGFAVKDLPLGRTLMMIIIKGQVAQAARCFAIGFDGPGSVPGGGGGKDFSSLLRVQTVLELTHPPLKRVVYGALPGG